MHRALPMSRSIALLALLWLPLSGATESIEDHEFPLPLDELRMFADVFHQIRESYVEEVDDRELLESAIRGMLSGLDPHSSYLDPDAFDNLQSATTGEFGGLGLEVGMENGFVKVISPIDDTPAERAGIQAGDLIIQLDNEPVKGMDLQEAVSLMRGPRDSEITLTIVREGRDGPFEVTIKRDTITVRSVRSRTLEPGFGYIRVAQFQSQTGEDFRRELEKFQQADDPLKGLVLDLRNNPGGLLQGAVQVAEAFLDEELIVSTRGRIANARNEYRARDRRAIDEVPIVVLINGGSASASEIVAGALQDHGLALVVGTPTFGKGSVQSVLPIAENRAIKLTTARYYTPSGRSIQAHGIDPDILVERARIETLDETGPISEADLRGHLSNGENREGPRELTPEEEEQRARTLEDNQLFEAFNILKGIYLREQRRAEKDRMRG